MCAIVCIADVVQQLHFRYDVPAEMELTPAAAVWLHTKYIPSAPCKTVQQKALDATSNGDSCHIHY
jgi:hypothetical protein